MVQKCFSSDLIQFSLRRNMLLVKQNNWEIFIELKPLLRDKKEGKMLLFLRQPNYVNYMIVKFNN